MKRQHSLSLSVQSCWTNKKPSQASARVETPMELLKRGFFDVTIVFPPNRGSSTKTDVQKDNNPVAQNESINDNASAKAAYLSPDTAKMGRINSYSDIMAVQ